MPPANCDDGGHVEPENAPISYHDAPLAMLLGTSSENDTDGFLLHAAASIAVAKRSSEPTMTVRFVGIESSYCDIVTRTERRSPAVTIVFATFTDRPFFSCKWCSPTATFKRKIGAGPRIFPL